ncbi:MAG: hypothetical protein BA863_10400 [Desulfovibrio sp. S3730MH75]|nr:MAG: hypothetical protein BA863_10400 [Desulfovibrio sp. S3730MH75]
MKTNAKWKPYLQAVRDVDKRGPAMLMTFINSHPKRLHTVVALGLSLAKWYIKLIEGENALTVKGSGNCGCCILCMVTCFRECPLGPCPGSCLICDHVGGIDAFATYIRIHEIYTEHFNALPGRNRQGDEQ